MLECACAFPLPLFLTLIHYSWSSFLTALRNSPEARVGANTLFLRSIIRKAPLTPALPEVTESVTAGEPVSRECTWCCQPQPLLWAPGDEGATRAWQTRCDSSPGRRGSTHNGQALGTRAHLVHVPLALGREWGGEVGCL